MKESEKSWMNNPFSHIYVEKDAINYPIAKEIIKRFPHAHIIEINRYTDITNRPRQNLALQKQSFKLILAVEKDCFLYQGPAICQDYGHPRFYYTTTIMNCLYDCHYCYLQGMYPCAHIIVFVNAGDFMTEVDHALKEGPLYLCVSYDTDMLALEKIVPYSRLWIEYARNKKGLLIEIRTKSANFKPIAELEPSPNVLLAWTLSPEEIIKKYENRTPPLKARLSSMMHAIEKGWPVRICLEPIIRTANWQDIYFPFIDEVFTTLPSSKIIDVNIGMFRMNREYFKKIQKSRDDTDLFSYPMDCRDGIITYTREQENEMTQALFERVSLYYPRERIYLEREREIR